MLTQGTILQYQTTGNTWSEITNVKSIPAPTNSKDQIETTHLTSTRKSYINGLADSESMSFNIGYTTAGYKAVFQALDGKPAKFRVIYPDKTGISFEGEGAVWRNETNVNEALDYTLEVTVSAGPDELPEGSALPLSAPEKKESK